MNRSSQWIEVGIAGAVLTLVALPAAATHHEPAERAEPAAAGERKPWDQASMTELSDQLATAMSELRRAYRREPSFREPNNPNRRAAQNMEQILRQLEQQSRQLRNRVGGGGSFEDTQGIARRIGTLLNDADVEGRRIMTSVWLDQRIQPAMKLINEIAPFYGSGPLYDPETMQKLDRPPNPDRRVPAE